VDHLGAQLAYQPPSRCDSLPSAACVEHRPEVGARIQKSLGYVSAIDIETDMKFDTDSSQLRRHLGQRGLGSTAREAVDQIEHTHARILALRDEAWVV
jgi:hypothetical protein